MNKKLALISVGIFLIVAAIIFQQKINYTPEAPYTTKVIINDKTLFVELVKSKEAMARGLSGREKLLENQGMIFDYGKGSSMHPGFWMPDMKFNLDIIWIKEHKIIGITKNVPAPKTSTENLPLYYPPAPVDMVLEVNAGESEGMEIEDRLIFK